jgi:hypothetical protein
MKLSRLKELRPDVWEEAKRQTIKQKGEEKWDYYVRNDVDISMAFTWINSDQEHKPWQNIYYHDDFTLYDEWLANQTKQPDPGSKKEIDYWRYQFAGMAMQATDLEQYANNFGNKWAEKVAIDSVQMADALIKELQKEKP